MASFPFSDGDFACFLFVHATAAEAAPWPYDVRKGKDEHRAGRAGDSDRLASLLYECFGRLVDPVRRKKSYFALSAGRNFYFFFRVRLPPNCAESSVMHACASLAKVNNSWHLLIFFFFRLLALTVATLPCSTIGVCAHAERGMRLRAYIRISPVYLIGQSRMLLDVKRRPGHPCGAGSHGRC